MGKASRDKGKRGERELAAKLREYGYEARRGVQYHGGENSPDVIGLPGMHIECKRTESLRLWDALAQAKHDAGSNMPCVMHRKNDCPWVVIMGLEDWMQIYAEWEAGQNWND